MSDPINQPIDASLLVLLRCPIDRSPLRQQGQSLISAAGRSYPIVDGIPVLLPESARGGPLDAGDERERPR